MSKQKLTEYGFLLTTETGREYFVGGQAAKRLSKVLADTISHQILHGSTIPKEVTSAAPSPRRVRRKS
jgi:hypothetical protein